MAFDEFMNPVRDFFGVGPEAHEEFYSQGLMSPKAAAWGQALGNITRMNMGGMPGVDPITAYQKAVQGNALMNMNRRQEQWKQRYQAATLAEKMRDKPSAFREKLTTYAQSLDLDPNDPMTLQDPRMQEFIEGQGGGITIDMGEQAEDAWAKNMLERNIGAYNTILDNAERADTDIQRYGQLAMLNRDISAQGRVGEALTALKQNLQGLGIDLPGVNEDTTPEELYKAIATENQFKRTQMLKGAISEKEIDLAGLMDGSLSNTQAGRDFILQYRIAEARRMQQLANAAEEWMSRTGERFDNRKFRKSDEFLAVRDRAFATPEMLELAKQANPQAMTNYKRDASGTWWKRGADGEAVPVF